VNTPSELSGPVFLMNLPLSVSNEAPNNVWMVHDQPYDKTLACRQWMKLYGRIAREALIYVLPGHGDLQDLPFVANIACYLPHLFDSTVVRSKFTSQPRVGEEDVGAAFFDSFPYYMPQSPYCWEGEADLKWVKSNLYVGGVGQRSTDDAYDWMESSFLMDVVRVQLTDPKLYHLDCVFMPLAADKALVNVSALSSDDIRKIENITEIIAVPERHKYDGWTNGIMLNGTMLHSAITSADDLAELLPQYRIECFDLSEFEKSGADLSCLIMHLNYEGHR
jgi:N-dimethylarginine dimethylaminohydrolase